MALLPQDIDAVQIPVIAAGGIEMDVDCRLPYNRCQRRAVGTSSL
jgi:hypothetical protein